MRTYRVADVGERRKSRVADPLDPDQWNYTLACLECGRPTCLDDTERGCPHWRREMRRLKEEARRARSAGGAE